MKKLIILFMIFTLLFATNNPNENKTKTDNKSSTLSNVMISYPVRALIKEKKDKR